MKHNITTLKKEVPKHIRLEVYKEALKGKHDLDNGLCIVLPSVLFNLNDSLDYFTDTETNEDWDFIDAKIAFPELTNKVIKKINSIRGGKHLRWEYLEQWIKELEGHNEQNNTEK